MRAIHFVTNIILTLYKGLVYWFFWASFASLHNEMFCSVRLSSDTVRCYQATSVGGSTPNGGRNLQQRICLAFCKLCDRFCRGTRQLRDAFDANTANNLANLRHLMEAAKDLPQRHLVRISLYSG
ncbi:MAG: hypothetical protein PUD89_08310 [Bacteroidales bacterium]|nr:hypothetical protein [Bacteroidales bacterium]